MFKFFDNKGAISMLNFIKVLAVLVLVYILFLLALGVPISLIFALSILLFIVTFVIIITVVILVIKDKMKLTTNIFFPQKLSEGFSLCLMAMLWKI